MRFSALVLLHPLCTRLRISSKETRGNIANIRPYNRRYIGSSRYTHESCKLGCSGPRSAFVLRAGLHLIRQQILHRVRLAAFLNVGFTVDRLLVRHRSKTQEQAPELSSAQSVRLKRLGTASQHSWSTVIDIPKIKALVSEAGSAAVPTGASFLPT